MARQSLSAQLAALREYTARLEVEVAGLRDIAADARVNDAELTKLRAELARRDGRRSFPSFSERARAYCKANDVRCVPSSVVATWRAEARA